VSQTAARRPRLNLSEVVMPTLPRRCDHVGSLLRPGRLATARQRWRDGELPADELAEVEDDAIRHVVEQQQRVGLAAITDGEFRRDWWHLDFLSGFDGIELGERPRPVGFSGTGANPPISIVTGKISHSHPIFVDAFAFLAATIDGVTDETAKITIPGPGMAYLQGGRAGIDETAYPDLDQFWSDLVAAYREEIEALYAAGCRYLQIDDVSFAYLCDAGFRKGATERGDDPDAMIRAGRDAMNAAIAGRPDDLLVATHMCRGNFRSRWVASGGYEPMAETVLGGLDVDAFFMEFDSERAGGFEPLRFLQPGKTVVLGLVTTKVADLEDDDEIVRRIDEASKVVPLEQLALSPQCGFSSTHHGNDLTEDDQWRKLELVARVAERVWGERS
jgi:5-methyltetrahydropteroyltriglutamate--homocysteine methyltransferase